MYTLGIDTSTQMCSVAIFHNEHGVIGEISQKIALNHSQTFLILIDQLLKNCTLETSEISTIALNGGPGSFTGLRIGMAFAKGLSHANGARVKIANSLDILASQVPCSNLPILSLIDAKNHRVYAALYHVKDGEVLQQSDYLVGTLPTVLTQFSDLKCIAIGDACESYKDKIAQLIPQAEFVTKSLNYLRASALCELAQKKEATPIEIIEPFYLLKTQAELQLEEKEAKNYEKTKTV